MRRLNHILGTAYSVEQVEGWLEEDPEYLARIAVAIRLDDKAEKFWGRHGR